MMTGPPSSRAVGLENAPLARKKRLPCSFTPSHDPPLDPMTKRGGSESWTLDNQVPPAQSPTQYKLPYCVFAANSYYNYAPQHMLYKSVKNVTKPPPKSFALITKTGIFSHLRVANFQRA